MAEVARWINAHEIQEEAKDVLEANESAGLVVAATQSSADWDGDWQSVPAPLRHERSAPYSRRGYP